MSSSSSSSRPSSPAGSSSPGSFLAALGWDPARQAAFDALAGACAADDLAPARVARVDRGACDALTASGPVRATYATAVFGTAVCTGDWVVLRTWPDDERVTVEHVLDRRSVVQRLEVTPGSSRSQPLAANVDVVLVAEGAVPDPDLGRLERLLALAWDSGAEPVVVLTKADLAGAGIDVLVRDVAAVAPGVAVHPVSSVTGAGLEDVRGHLGPGRTAVLLGASGVGKSTLVNALHGATVMATRALRVDGKGRHTTVTRELVPLPDGAVLLDTPGLRSIGLNVTEDAIARVFADVDELAARCRFADCAHESEPGCAVREALETGELTERRLRSWHKLQRQALHEQARTDARLRAERRSEWVRRAKAYRGQRDLAREREDPRRRR